MVISISEAQELRRCVTMNDTPTKHKTKVTIQNPLFYIGSITKKD